jgi:hypothetical protein
MTCGGWCLVQVDQPAIHCNLSDDIAAVPALPCPDLSAVKPWALLLASSSDTSSTMLKATTTASNRDQGSFKYLQKKQVKARKGGLGQPHQISHSVATHQQLAPQQHQF